MAQLLRRYAGLDIGRTGGPGQQTSLFIRGGNSNHTLLLVDGVVVNSGSTGAAALQHLDPDLIERIEVLKGPRSSLYGSSAIAGVVQVFTRKGPRSGVDVGARLGSHQSRDLRAHAAWHGDDASRVSLAASSQRVDAFKPLADNPRERDYSQNSLSLDARRAFGNGDVVLSIWNSQAQVGYLDFFGTTELDQDTRNRSLRLATNQLLRPAWALEAAVSTMTDRVEQTQGDDYARTHATTLSTRNRWTLSPGQDLSLDLAWTDETLRALSGSAFGSTPVAEHRDHLATGLQYQLDSRLLLLQATLSHEDHDAFEDQLLWNLDTGWRIGERFTVLALAGTGFRAPTVLDRFGFGGNPALDPERSRSAELGLRWVPDNRLRLELRVFENRVRDLVIFDSGSFSLQNVDRARTRGVEASAFWQRGPWRADFSASAQDPEDRGTGKTLVRRSRESAGLGLGWSGSRLGLHAELIARGPRRAVNDEQLGGYALFNLGGSLVLGDGWSLQWRAENLLDADYQSAAGFNEPGQSGWLGLRWQSD